MGSRLGFVGSLSIGWRANRTGDSCMRRRVSVIVSVAVPDATGVLSSPRLAQIPWEKSIAGDDVDLLFMPFVQLQKEVMEESQEDLRDLPFDEELSFQSSTRKKARIESWNFSSRTFRKIRMTYIDAGIAAQVFNSVWYPDPRFDLPVLGIDFLSFGKKKVLCVLDFQPLKQDADYVKKYTSALSPIRQSYPSLAGQMSARFYDENKFFSPELAFGKFDNSGPVKTELFPAFKEYLHAYLDMFKTAPENTDPESIAKVMELQKEYDQYSAERDPAVGLFSTYFGPDWAVKFTHDFLFELSETPESEP